MECNMFKGELAKRSGVSNETIRYYHKEGLLPEPDHRVSGYRTYTQEHVTRVQFIRDYKALGFSLKQIRYLIELDLTCDETRREFADATKEQILVAEERMRTLRKSLKTLKSMLET
ncbi:MAG: MerR family transcriptional regulator [Planctomycetes bacterium]|nr:MerR family transcriptional regulator [Planctomycetota bacterium]